MSTRTFIVTSDFGVRNADTDAVSEAGRKLAPDYAILCGDVIYPPHTALAETVGFHYRDPRNDSSGNPLPTVWPIYAAVGFDGADVAQVIGGEAEWLNYFGYAALNYSILEGPLRIIVLNSEEFEGMELAGVLADPTMVFCQDQLAASVAAGEPWRAVVWHRQSHALVTDDRGWLQVPLKDWGCDVLFHGGSHQFSGRTLRDGLVAVCVGNGGKGPAGTERGYKDNGDFFNDKDFGLLHCYVDDVTFAMQSINVTGANDVGWGKTLTRPAPPAPPLPPTLDPSANFNLVPGSSQDVTATDGNEPLLTTKITVTADSCPPQVAPDIDPVSAVNINPGETLQVPVTARNPQAPTAETTISITIIAAGTPPPPPPPPVTIIDNKDAGFL